MGTAPRSARSSDKAWSLASGISAWIRATAVAALSRSRHAKTVSALCRARARAVSKPMPELAPVTSATRPARSGIRSKADAMEAHLRDSYTNFTYFTWFVNCIYRRDRIAGRRRPSDGPPPALVHRASRTPKPRCTRPVLLSGYFSILAALDGLGTNRPGEEDEHGTDLWCQGHQGHRDHQGTRSWSGGPGVSKIAGTGFHQRHRGESMASGETATV